MTDAEKIAMAANMLEAVKGTLCGTTVEAVEMTMRTHHHGKAEDVNAENHRVIAFEAAPITGLLLDVIGTLALLRGAK